MDNRLYTSMRHAMRGLHTVFVTEANFRMQLIFGLAALAGVIVFPLQKMETIVVFMLIAFVLTLEVVNSALERFLDVLKPRLSYQVEAVKDMLAGAVLVGSFFSLIIGMLIFLPHITVMIIELIRK
ncbi:MAG: diacylglycerol kinase [Candidatus Magasanikbacteria bacterium]|jgi:undecaprenol kinase|nr:diacylglycerol kinase [Candidatus Magasanikbacteria bacterium]